MPRGMKTNATCNPALRWPVRATGQRWRIIYIAAGAADIIGATAIAQQCRSLEKACEGTTLPVESEIVPRLQALLRDIAALNQAITAFTTPR